MPLNFAKSRPNHTKLFHVNDPHITVSMVLWFSALKGRSRKHGEGRTYRGRFVSEEIRLAGYHPGKGAGEKCICLGIVNVPENRNSVSLLDSL